MELTGLSASRIVRFLLVHICNCNPEPTRTHCSSLWRKTYSSRASMVFACMTPSNIRT